MTADPETRVRRRPSWAWRWGFSLVAAQCGGCYGALFPGDAIAAFEQFVSIAQRGSSPRWVSGLHPDPALGAFFGFVLSWMTALVLLAIYIVAREPRPRL